MSADFEPFEEVEGDEEYKNRCLFSDIYYDKFEKDDDEYALTRRVGAFFVTKERTRYLGIISYLYSANVYIPYCDDGKIATGDFNGKVGICVYTVPDIIPVDVAMEYRWERIEFRKVFDSNDKALFLINYACDCVALRHDIVKRMFAMMASFTGRYDFEGNATELSAIKQMVAPNDYFKKRQEYRIFREKQVGIPNYTYIRQGWRWLSITKDDGSKDRVAIAAVDKIIQLED